MVLTFVQCNFILHFFNFDIFAALSFSLEISAKKILILEINVMGKKRSCFYQKITCLLVIAREILFRKAKVKERMIGESIKCARGGFVKDSEIKQNLASCVRWI